MNNIKKLIRFTQLYGSPRAVVKAVGRMRLPISLVRKSRIPPDIAVVGCGQFAFSTIGYFLARRFGARMHWCYDTNPLAMQSFARFYRVRHQASDPGAWNADPDIRYVYIASNHFSHTDYAVESMKQGKVVHVEKPVSVSLSQLARLEKTRIETEARIFAGYNRPFSAAVRRLRRETDINDTEGFSLACFVSGHVLPEHHWYREPREGTRICGNAGHWIDLFVHICGWRTEQPDRYRISLRPASDTNPDDNFALTITTDRDDVFSLVLTSRSEPFEGINETINFQYHTIIAKIDDFRSMTIWKGPRRLHARFWPKDVGHKRAVLQPFEPQETRPWSEVLRSSILTLRIAEMVVNRTAEVELSMATELAMLAQMQSE